MGESFTERLESAQKRAGSALCVGLDPDIARLPPHLLSKYSALEAVEQFCLHIIDQTADLACAYKLNFAFFEVLGPGSWETMNRILEHIPNACLTIADAKRGDIGNTAAMYAASVFETQGFDACTVNAYMGRDSVSPFLSYPQKGVFILTLTSNPSSRDFQLSEADGLPLYERVAEIGATWSLQTPGTLGYVVGGTHAEALENLRRRHPTIPFLVPGVGAQGARPETVMRCATDEGRVIVNSSRAILFASDGIDFADAARIQAKRLSTQLAVH